MAPFIHGEETHALSGACFEVYKNKGCGFPEAVYQECLELELADRCIPFVAQPRLQLEYKGRVLSQTYQPDFFYFERAILEIKAVTELADEHRAQMNNYLKGTGRCVGLLVNLGHFPLVEHERIVR